MNYYCALPGRQTSGCEFVEVWLDGARQALCIEASRPGGWMRRYRLDEFGNIERDGLLEQPKTEVLYGVVEIRHCR